MTVAPVLIAMIMFSGSTESICRPIVHTVLSGPHSATGERLPIPRFDRVISGADVDRELTTRRRYRGPARRGSGFQRAVVSPLTAA